MDDAVACCSVSISGASLSRDKVSAASGVPFCHVSNTGGSLSCNSVWVTSVVEFCCVLTSGGHSSCINAGVSLSFAPSTVAGCSSAGVAFFAARGGGYLGSGGINMNHQFFRSPGAGAIRIVEWSFCSSDSTDRRSNTLPSAPH
jgi:hypothetical protein